MRRLWTFFLGMVTGGLLLMLAQEYHIVRADDGMHIVRKVNPSLKAVYVDIRNFTIADWRQHPNVAAALVRADKSDLVQNAASDALRQSLDQWLGEGQRP